MVIINFVIFFLQFFKAPPSPPKGPLDVSDITDNTATLAWKPPASDGGSPIKSYVVQKKEEGKDWHTGKELQYALQFRSYLLVHVNRQQMANDSDYT